MDKVRFALLGLLLAVLILVVVWALVPNKAQEDIEYDLDMEFQAVRGEINQLKAENEKLEDRLKLSVSDEELRAWVK